MSKFIVVGGGLAGVATAYELVRRGHETTLIERHQGVGLEASYANGALLTPAMAEPWNAPGVHRLLAASLFDPHSAMKLRLSAIPSLMGWGVRFLACSNPERHEAATKASFVLAKYSVGRTGNLSTELGLTYDARAVGTLKIFRTIAAMETALAVASKLAPLGLRFEVLNGNEAVAAEPALVEIRSQIAAALRFPDDESGDARQFCEQLAEAFRKAGGTLRTDARVSALSIERGTVSGVMVGKHLEYGDGVIVTAGNASAALLRPAGVSVPIRPVKGYTLTFDASRIEGGPMIPIIDDGLHAAIVPLGSRLRVAGTAEFAGEDLHLVAERVENLITLLNTILPRIAQQLSRSSAQPWVGLRPMSADGLPFIGPTRTSGLYINAGHGHLGWTHSVGSACLLADIIDGKNPDIDPSPYSPLR
jgi:D-amino-acid dehydrogenase